MWHAIDIDSTNFCFTTDKCMAALIDHCRCFVHNTSGVDNYSVMESFCQMRSLLRGWEAIERSWCLTETILTAVHSLFFLAIGAFKNPALVSVWQVRRWVIFFSSLTQEHMSLFPQRQGINRTSSWATMAKELDEVMNFCGFKQTLTLTLTDTRSVYPYRPNAPLPSPPHTTPREKSGKTVKVVWVSQVIVKWEWHLKRLDQSVITSNRGLLMSWKAGQQRRFDLSAHGRTAAGSYGSLSSFNQQCKKIPLYTVPRGNLAWTNWLK